jgi:hypothetical protein
MNNTTASPLVLGALPQLLVHCLGSQALWRDWQHSLKPCGAFLQPSQEDETALLQNRGLVIHMQCLDEAQALGATTQQEPNWAMQSITLLAPASGESPWLYDWPLGIQAQALNKAEVLQALGACGGEAVMSTKSMTLIDLQAMEGQDAIRAMGVQCEWQGQQLARLTLLHMGSFEPLQPFEFAEAVPTKVLAVSQAPVEVRQIEPAITCRSEERTPKTGLYEAHVLRSHPNAHYYNNSPNRFYFSQEGKPMIRLGVPDGGESLVVWTWRSDGAQRPC